MWLMLLALATGVAQDGTDVPDVNAQTFRPTVEDGTFTWTDESRRVRGHAVTARAVSSYAHKPLVLRIGEDRVALVEHLAQLDLLGAWAWGPVRVGIDLPLYLYASSEVEPASPGLGDLQLDVKTTLLDRLRSPVGLALGGRLWLPTAMTELPLSHQAVVGEASIIVDARLGDWTVAADLGARFGPTRSLVNVTLNDALTFRTGIAWQAAPAGGLTAELTGQVHTASAAGTLAGTTMEWMAGGWYRSGYLTLRAGFGTGITPGVGSPVARGMVGIGWEIPVGKQASVDAVLAFPCDHGIDDEDCVDEDDGTSAAD